MKQIIHESFIMRFLSILCLTMIVGWPFQANSQVTTTVDCDLMGLVVNVGSDSSSVNLYHPGGYLTWPPAYNVMNWEFTDSEGNLIHEATTQDENFIQVVHNLPVTDTLFVSVLLTNDSAFHNGVPVACLIEDYLFWEVDTWPNSGRNMARGLSVEASVRMSVKQRGWTIFQLIGLGSNCSLTCCRQDGCERPSRDGRAQGFGHEWKNPPKANCAVFARGN